MKYGGVYEAKVSGFSPEGLPLVLIPQVYGSAQVPVAAVVGDTPEAEQRGMVAFISSEAEYPVWLGDGETSLQGLNSALESTNLDLSALDGRLQDVENNYVKHVEADPVTFQDRVDFDDDVYIDGPGLVLNTTVHVGTGGQMAFALYNDSYINNLRDPVLDSEAVHKGYVDDLVLGAPWGGTADTSWREVSDVSEPVDYEGTWGDHSAGYHGAAFRIDEEGWVHLRGLVAGGSGGTTVFTLPSGYRFSSELGATRYFTTIGGGNLPCYVRMYDDGRVQVEDASGGSSVNNYCTLDGIQFPSASSVTNYDREMLFGSDHRSGSQYDENAPWVWKRRNGFAVVNGITDALSPFSEYPAPAGDKAQMYSAVFPLGNASTTFKRLFFLHNSGYRVPDTTTSWSMHNGEWGTMDTVNDWTDMSLDGTWTTMGFTTNDWNHCAYLKDQYGFVHLAGRIQGGALSTSQITQLPVGFRPSKRIIFPQVSSGASSCRIDIDSNGVVWSPAGGSTSEINLYGINFYAEQ